jgi:photosystem II stability/assembly factor-like uncharacterized protein
MRGDYSRLRFRPHDHYSAVRMQQGRVHLDSEWNEQVDIEAHRDRMTALDVIGESGFPFESGGFELATGAYLRGISFHSSVEGLAVGEDATILRSLNRGVEWSPMQAPEGTGHLNAVHSLGSGDAWAVGDDTTILRLTGSVWAAQAAPAPAQPGPPVALRSVVFADADDGIAVGDRGTVLRHTSAGWAVDTFPGTTARLRAVAALSPARVWIVGDGATILGRTPEDDGWAEQVAPAETGDLYGVFFVRADEAELGWAVGAGATILATTDGGVTWVRQQAPVGLTATLRDVRFVDGTSGVVVGDGGVILATDDGGQHWHRVESEAGDANLLSLCQISSLAHAAGDNVVLNSTESLFSWSLGSLPEAGRTITIGAGDGYVEGIRVVNDRTVSFAGQSGAPDAALPGDAGIYGAYLRVVEHHLTGIEHDELREVALGGPDTTTRTRTTWSVALRPLGVDEETCGSAEANRPSGVGGGRMRARSAPGEQATSECIVPPGGGYRRLENQLYRVEVLRGGVTHGDDDEGNGNGNGNGNGAGPPATFTWSRDNGSVAMRLVALDGASNAVTIAKLVDDELLGLSPKQWIEISDETRALRGDRGLIARIKSVRGDIVEVESFEDRPGGGTWTTADFPRYPTVRRWEGTGEIDPDEGWLALEDGVEVQFEHGEYRTGDFWTIPARTLSGGIVWERDGAVPVFDAPHGEHLRWATLAVLSRMEDGTWTVLDECRRRFPPLTGLVNFYYVGGDGQEATPDPAAPAPHFVQLDEPLCVGVSNWRWPVRGASVEFEVVQGGGRLFGASRTKHTTLTDEDGVARCDWHLNGDVAQLHTQQVRATLLDDEGLAMQTPILFNANLSVAAEVAYDPRNCGTLREDRTVQRAITKLSRLTRVFPLSGSGIDVGPGQAGESPLRVEVIALNECGPVQGATVNFAPEAADHGTVSPTSATTDAQGRASTSWTLHAQTPTQRLTATLAGAGADNTRHLPDRTVFVANLNLASDTAYTAACPALGGARTVQAAIDALARLPRLHAVTGDGASAAPSDLVRLEALVASDCGRDDQERRVRFRIDEGDGALEGIGPDGTVVTSNGRARCNYRMGAGARHLIQAQLVREGEEIFQPPVFFTITRLEARDVRFTADCDLLRRSDADTVQEAISVLCRNLGTSPSPPQLTLRLEQRVLTNVEDPAGLWQHDGGRVLNAAGNHVANYVGVKRIMPRATEGQNTGSVTMTLFFLGSAPPENITVQGTHDFGSGRQVGSVSAASAPHAAYIGRNFVRVGEQVTLG